MDKEFVEKLMLLTEYDRTLRENEDLILEICDQRDRIMQMERIIKYLVHSGWGGHAKLPLLEIRVDQCIITVSENK